MKILVFNGSLGITETLRLIIKSAKENDVNKILCLGDLIGIGNGNLECLNIARENEIQLISGIFEGILTNQIDSSEMNEAIIDGIVKLRNDISKEDLLWLSDLKRLTIIDNLLFMYGSYIDRYALFTREGDFVETDLITRKKHPMLDGLVIGSSNQQGFYNGKKLLQIRTKREYEYIDIKNAKFIASPGRLFSPIRNGEIKSTWIIIDTDKKMITFLSDKVQTENTFSSVDSYDLENIFSL